MCTVQAIYIIHSFFCLTLLFVTVSQIGVEELHPADRLRQVVIHMLRSVTICCGLYAEHMQPSAIQSLTSLLRTIVQVSIISNYLYIY